MEILLVKEIVLSAGHIKETNFIGYIKGNNKNDKYHNWINNKRNELQNDEDIIRVRVDEYDNGMPYIVAKDIFDNVYTYDYEEDIVFEIL